MIIRALEKEHIFISRMPSSSPNPMFDHLLNSSHLTQVELIEVIFMRLIWSPNIISLMFQNPSLSGNGLNYERD